MSIVSERLEPSSRPCQDIAIFEREMSSTMAGMGLGSLCLFEQNFLTAEVLNEARYEAATNSASLPADKALDVIYPRAHEACATRSLLGDNEVLERLEGTKFAILAVDGNDPRSVAARRVEAKWFHTEFGTHPSDHELTFSNYSDSSLFVYMLDMSDANRPRPCGVLRFIKPSDHGLKTVNILSKNEHQDGKYINPWFNDLAAKIPGFADTVTDTRKKMIYEFFDINPETTWDVPTMALDAEYKGNNADDVTPAWGLYTACVNTAMALGAESFINTQDVAPMRLMQFRFARLWTDEKTRDENGNRGKYGFTPVPYDGPAPVVPACLPNLEAFRKRLFSKKPQSAAMLFEPEAYHQYFKIPQDLQPEFFL